MLIFIPVFVKKNETLKTFCVLLPPPAVTPQSFSPLLGTDNGGTLYRTGDARSVSVGTNRCPITWPAETEKTNMKISQVLEIARFVGVFAGFWLAFSELSDPERAFHWLAVCVVVSIAGMTGIESLFFGKQAAAASGYSDPGHYQRQSGFNNLAVAILGLVVFFLNWGTHAEAAICSVLLVFLTLSSINHLHSRWRDGNPSWRGFTRPLGTLVLLIAVLPFMFRALSVSS
jgi:hypothetical protein